MATTLKTSLCKSDLTKKTTTSPTCDEDDSSDDVFNITGTDSVEAGAAAATAAIPPSFGDPNINNSSGQVDVDEPDVLYASPSDQAVYSEPKKLLPSGT